AVAPLRRQERAQTLPATRGVARTTGGFSATAWTADLMPSEVICPHGGFWANAAYPTRYCPPLSDRVHPVTYPARSPDSHDTMSAISSPLPRRPTGIWATMASSTF